MDIEEYIESSDYLKRFFKFEEIYIKDLTNGINEVFLLENKKKDIQIILKRALPYFKQYGPKHPLNVNRILYEAKALKFFKSCNQNFVPNLYFFDEKENLIVIEYIKNKISLNQFLQRGIINKNFSEQISDFLSANFLKTSTFGTNAEEREKLLNTFQANKHMEDLSVQFIFTDLIDRYTKLTNSNKKTNALFLDLDSQNSLLFKNIEGLKNKFISQNDCLLHGDLKGASILLNEDDISIIDYEFSNFGPISYDLSSIIYVFVALTINYDLARCDKEYISWLLFVIEDIWYKFKEKISLNKKIDTKYYDMLLKDMIGFMGVQMLSMMIPHVVPFNSNNIKKENEDIYYTKMGLIAKTFVNNHKSFNSIEQAVKVLKTHLQYY
ncbi:MAG: phosphotransferase [Halarcobacter sp.]